MKKLISFGVLIATFIALAMPAMAQINTNPNTVPPFFYTTLFSAKTDTNSQTDTSATYFLGGSHLLALQILNTDSMMADVYVDYKLWGSTSWTNVVADSIKQSGAGDTLGITTVKEITVRNMATDALGKIGCYVRARIAMRAAGNSILKEGYYTARWIWKP